MLLLLTGLRGRGEEGKGEGVLHNKQKNRREGGDVGNKTGREKKRERERREKEKERERVMLRLCFVMLCFVLLLFVLLCLR